MLEIKFDKNGKIYSHIKDIYKIATPEEKVRQNYVCTLVNAYGYDLSQMDEERETTGRGSGGARADIIIWESAKAKNDGKTPLIIVECKADNIHISEKDYLQGELYARQTDAPFFVTHNSYETRFWRVMKDKMPGYRQEISNIPQNGANKKEIENLLKSLVAFKEDEFANLLHKCHNIIRNIEKLDPAAAFDEIAKILFMKVYVERLLLKNENSATNIFTKDYLDKLEENMKSNPLIQTEKSAIETLFENTKKEFAKDQIFSPDEKINLKQNTIIKIISELEIYNLSLTSADVKGIAFERFLGRTFRGEIGQFFTPRSIVNFMVDMIDPQENETACDPASGSGGFLIRIFSRVRELIQADIVKLYDDFKNELIGDKEATAKQAEILNQKYDELQESLNLNNKESRLFKLSNYCIFGTDANDRMARTSKMNMIMHGDGHGGIHHHDGLLNINGIFEDRFDIILTNPPFGSQVEKDDLIEANSAQMYKNDKGEIMPRDGFEEYIKGYYKLYGEKIYKKAQLKILDNIGKPIASLFKLKENLTSDKTEHLFINRSLDLLKPGGRMGIVLPEGVFNTPNAAYVRTFVEGRAFIRAVVSLPSETFLSSGASVKCSILFVQKFSLDEQSKWDELLNSHKTSLEISHKDELDRLNEIILYRKEKGEKEAKFSADDKKRAKAELKALQDEIAKQSWQNAKNDFDYPIFMAEPESVGITSTGETGANVPNELMDSFDENGNLKDKGIATLFKEFLEQNAIAWSAK
ncbi:N-6 DNA methylase [Campylobacter mucosalis]|uniref:Type I restriction/modification system, M subunit (HsdR N-terminal domain) n=1 Tax=Campylobacter mucosalis CCUG 21559 TaxID=1032067 RepID=A0A6G5QH63_9BACT|nr:N-6 DNA methylase [Campylobacter mucosalis]QCD44917.1 type I restriction/modification system, M subunit (HsdR N-terminal domain) [Campylobacter mucosalis CCUG 21559]